jgi:DMSO reductase family type II enzyme heme b subunit
MGDRKLAVNIWQWKASDNLAVELNAQGPGSVSQQEKQDVKVTGAYKDGLYRVVFTRLLDTKDQGDPVFELGKFIPLAVTLYDGRNNEENTKGAISGWYYMMLEPPSSLQVYVLPPLAFLVVLGILMGLRKKLAKKK